MMDYKLCFVRDQWAYFTKKPLTGKGCQTGDDWNDAPYEMNASPPYGDEPGDIILVAYKSELQTPSDYHYNAPYSVDQINSGIVPWLCDYYGHLGLGEEANNTKIMAGCSFEEFVTIVMEHGGEIYLKVHENDSKAESRGPATQPSNGGD